MVGSAAADRDPLSPSEHRCHGLGGRVGTARPGPTSRSATTRKSDRNYATIEVLTADFAQPLASLAKMRLALRRRVARKLADRRNLDGEISPRRSFQRLSLQLDSRSTNCRFASRSRCTTRAKPPACLGPNRSNF